MVSAITLIIAVSMAVVLAGLLGYWAQKGLGVLILVFLVVVGATVTLAFFWLGSLVGAITGGLGLLVGVAASSFIVGWLFAWIASNPRSATFMGLLWFGFCALSIFGYQAGGVIGLLTITLPAILLFWIELYHLSAYLLPLRDKNDKAERTKAFRSLFTFTLGTNYPFYVVDEASQPIKRVDGNQFRKIFAGPGMVITDSDHAVYVTDGVFVKGVFEPGLTFTGLYDMEPRIIDLRPQLRAFPVDALTKDGIPISVVTFMPCRIDPANQAVELGQGFPFRPGAVYQAMAHEVVERKADKKAQDNGKKYRWDGGPQDGLVPLLVTPIVQDVLSHYTLDDLCAPFDGNKDPRVKIATEIRNKAKETLRAYGLELIGGGISNLLPKDKGIMQRRIDTWRTKWVGEMLIQMSESQAYRQNQLQMARAKSEIEMVKRFGQIIKSSVRTDLNRTLLLGLIDSLRDVVGDKEEQRRTVDNKELEATLKYLRGEN